MCRGDDALVPGAPAEVSGQAFAVPRLRIWKHPTNGATRANNGTAWRTCVSAPTLASVVPAPIQSSWPLRSMRYNSRMIGECRYRSR
jgi:hypothetical protein